MQHMTGMCVTDCTNKGILSTVTIDTVTIDTVAGIDPLIEICSLSVSSLNKTQ